MAVEHLDFGDSVAGLLVDGVDGTPYVGATLKFQEPRGVRVDVPHIGHDATGQFNHVEAWFQDQSPPENMLLVTEEGTISLFGIRWSGHSTPSGDRLARGALTPQVTVLHRRDGALSDPLEFKEMRSRVDGLNEWTRISAVETEHETDKRNRTKAVHISVKSPRPVYWRQGDVLMSLRSDWRVTYPKDAYDVQTVVHDVVVVNSKFDTRASFQQHYQEQAKVANLMVLLFGAPISFREHRIRDTRFAARMMGGKVYNHPFVELISETTTADRTVPIPASKDLKQPLAHLSQLGAEGLATWAANYEEWRRFILPAVSVLGKKQAFIEDIVVSTSMALEAAGHRIGTRPKEAGLPLTAKNFYRCLDRLDLDFGDAVPNNRALALAMANNYNDVKHADRGDFPSHGPTAVISYVNRFIVRLIALTLTGKAEELLPDIRRHGLWQVKQRFEGWELRLDDEGNWIAQDVN